MDKYTDLKNRIDVQYNHGEVEQTENIISLYDLYVLLDREMKAIRGVKKLDWFKDKVNSDRTFFKRVGLFKRQAIIDKKCEYVYSDVYEDKSMLLVRFAGIEKSLIVYKDFDSDELYFSDYCIKDRAFVEKYLSDIYGIFATLEQYGTLFPYKENKERENLSQIFDDGLFRVDLSCDTDGIVNFSLEPSKGVDEDKIYSREWYSRETIATYVDDRKWQIFRCIPVEISSLNDVYRKIVEDAISKRKAHWLVKDISGIAN